VAVLQQRQAFFDVFHIAAGLLEIGWVVTLSRAGVDLGQDAAGK
jgi:hypothetical protein